MADGKTDSSARRGSQKAEVEAAVADEHAAVEEGLPSRADKAAAKREAAQREPRFERSRLVDPNEGQAITGHPAHVVAGALHDVEGEEFTRAEVGGLIDAFLGREQTNEEDE